MSDILGLDEEVKLTTRAKVARLDYERIMGENGLPYILHNHAKVTKTIARRDKHFSKTHKGKHSRNQKYQHEADNLGRVLEFYQLWCHGLFPKANFSDCIDLIRGLGAKSAPLKLYRREMLSRELDKLKVESEMAEEEPEVGVTEVNEETVPEDEDWSFMNRPRKTGLFVDSDEEVYEKQSEIDTPEMSVPNTVSTVPPVPNTVSTVDSTVPNPTAPTSMTPSIPDESDDPFSDDDDVIIAKPGPEEYPDEDDLDMELMREYS